jgi:hypothetical protein
MLTIIIISAVTLLAVAGFAVVRSASNDINNNY